MTKLASEYILAQSILNTSGQLNYSSFNKLMNCGRQASTVNKNDAHVIL